MAVITFWSNGKEETAKTLSIAAVATYMAIEHNYRILVLSTNYNDSTLEGCFWEQENNQKLLQQLNGGKTDLESGIEGLAKIIASGKTSPDLVTNYTKIILNNRLEILSGFKTENYTEYERIRRVYADIIQVANRYYDLVLVDLNKGLDNEFIREIIEESDLLIVNSTQRLKIINDVIELKKTEPLFQKNNIMLLIGRYDKFSKYNTKNLSRYFGEKKEISAIPYNTLFFEACNEGKVVDFFLRNRKIDVNDRNAIFITDVKKTTENIIMKLQELQMRM